MRLQIELERFSEDGGLFFSVFGFVCLTCCFYGFWLLLVLWLFGFRRFCGFLFSVSCGFVGVCSQLQKVLPSKFPKARRTHFGLFGVCDSVTLVCVGIGIKKK